MSHRITDYVNYTATELSEQVIADALNFAETIADASFDFPSDPWQLGKGYLDTDNRKWRKKIGFKAGFTTRDYKPIITLINQKTGETTTFTPSYTPTFTPPKRRQAPQTNIQTCPTCSKHHDGKHPKCYYCYIDGLYQQASPPTNHPYLAKKGISLSLAMSLGIKESNGKLIIPLTGGNGGYQVITHGGKFTAVPDGMAGMYVPVGWMNPTRIYICEGIATAVSAHLALDHGVVAALSTANLGHVVGHFRDKFPSAEIIILADNDAGSFFRKTTDNPRGTENPGKTIAYEVGEKHGCLVSLPPTYDKADWNDYYLTHGDVATKQAINAETAPPLTPWSDVADTVVSLSPSDLVDGKYLPESLLSPHLPPIVSPPPRGEGEKSKAIIGIKSPMGTGKTRGVLKQVLAYAYANELSFGYSAHLQSLVRNACTELGINPHTDFDSLDRVMDKPLLGFCTNGFSNKLWQPDKETDFYDVVILDEVEQQLRAIVSGTVSNKLQTFNELKRQVQAATVAIAMDADLSPSTLKLLSGGYEGAITAIENPVANWNDRQITLTDETYIMKMLHKTLMDGGKVLVPCASKKKGQAILKMLEEFFPEKVFWLATQKTAKEHADFLNDPNQILLDEQPDGVIYTTVIGSGFSIDVEGYFDLCCLFGGVNLPVDALYQLMGRYRHWERFYCSIPEHGNGSDKSRDDYLNEVLGKAQQELQALAYLDPALCQIDQQHPFYGLYADIKHEDNQSKRNLLENFIAKGHQLGAKVVDGVQSSKEAEKATRQTMKEVDRQIKVNEAEKIVELYEDCPMTEAEAEAYETSRIARGGDDYYRFRAYEYERFYGEPPTVEGLIEDDYGNRHEIIKRYENILKNRHEVEQAALNNIENATYKGEIDATQVRGMLVHYDLIHALIKAIGLEFEGGVLNATQALRIDKETLTGNEALMRFMNDNRQAINVGCLGFTVTDNTLDNPVKFVRMALESIGVKLISKRSGATRYKVVDTAHLAKLNEIIEKRRQAQFASLHPSINKPITNEVTRIEYTETIDGVQYGFDNNGNGTIIATEAEPGPQPAPTPAPVAQQFEF